jgi:predicted DNA-binding transcriptional regulator AlpA
MHQINLFGVIMRVKIDAQSNQFGLLTRKEILSLLRISGNTLTRYVKSGSFPKPIVFGGNTLCKKMWRLSDIRDYIDNN